MKHHVNIGLMGNMSRIDVVFFTPYRDSIQIIGKERTTPFIFPVLLADLS
jgi:hypothetical protein